MFLTVARGPSASYTNSPIFPTKHAMYRRAYGCRLAASSRNVDCGPFFIFTKKSARDHRHERWRDPNTVAVVSPRGQGIYLRAVSLHRTIYLNSRINKVSYEYSYCKHRELSEVESNHLLYLSRNKLLDGGAPPLNYRVKQVLTGHGCFEEYLR